MVSAAQASVTCRTPAGRAPAGPLPATCRPVHTEADGRPRPLGRCRVRSSASKLRCHVPLVQALPVLVPPPPPVLVPPPPCKCHQHCQRRAHRLCCHCCHITGTMGGGAGMGAGAFGHRRSSADEGQTERQDIRKPSESPSPPNEALRELSLRVSWERASSLTPTEFEKTQPTLPRRL